MNTEYVEDITLADIKKRLVDKAKEKDLNYEQKLAYEHAKKFSNITPANAKKLKEKLLELELSDELSTKIIDILPNKARLDLITEKEKNFDESKIDDILELVNKYKK